MKALIASVLISLVASSAFAHSLTCTLESNGVQDSVKLKLHDAAAADGKYGENGVGDFNIHVSAVATGDEQYNGYITIDSGILEDEFRSVGFTIEKSQEDSEVFNLEIDNAPDGQKYSITCTFNKR